MDITRWNLANLRITPPPNSDADFTMTVSATSTEASNRNTAQVERMLAVRVDAVADAPSLSVNNSVRTPEDTPVNLGLSSALVDTDGSESLTLAISGAPAGAVLSDGNHSVISDGLTAINITTWTLGNVTVQAPLHSDAEFTLMVRATAIETHPTSTDLTVATASADTVATIAVQVDAVADAPTLTVRNVSGNEDRAIPLSLESALVDTDGSETLTLAISGAPAGVVLTDGISSRTSDGVTAIDITGWSLAEVTVQAPLHSDSEFELTVRATATEAHPTSTDLTVALGSADTVATIAVQVDAVADQPTLSVVPAMGDEDSAIPLSIVSALVDTDNSEMLSVVISGVPAGAALSDGTDNGDGSWTLTPTQLANLTITPPPDSDLDFTLTVMATSTEAANGHTASTSDTIAVTVHAVADQPALTVSPAMGDEDNAIPLSIVSALVDTDGSESLSLTISGVPAGVALSDGTDNGDGSWTLTPTQLANLTITPPPDSDLDFTLTVTATSTEAANGDSAQNVQTLDVTVHAVADQPTLTVSAATGNEDSAIPLSIVSALVDTDNSETLSVVISGVPAGAVLSDGTNTSTNSTVDVTTWALANLTITPPPDSDLDFTLTVTATSTEAANGDSAQNVQTLDVTVRNIVDIRGRVFDDLNNNGQFDNNDIGFVNVQIDLVNESTGTIAASATTGVAGMYEFDFSDLGLGAGVYTIRQHSQPAGYLDGKESVGNLGGIATDNGTVVNDADSNAITGIVIREPGTQQDTAGYDFAEIRSSSLQGMVWEDFNNDGSVDFGENAIEGVQITLSGIDDRGNTVSISQSTDAQGIFEFMSLRPSNAAGYSLTETQPVGFTDGKDVVGLVNGTPTGGNNVNDQFSNILLAMPDSVGINYNFGERFDGGTLGSGQTAGIGFWQNKNGQRLIESLNGSRESTLLAEYLAGTFSNMYGMLADADGDGITDENRDGVNDDYMTNSQVAKFYQGLFKRNGKPAPGGPPKVDAQVMAAALATYITRQSLVEVNYVTGAVDSSLVTHIESTGFDVTLGGVGSTYVNVGSNGEAFGVDDDSNVSIIDLLLATNSMSSAEGLLYDLDGDGEIDPLEELDRIMANDIYSLINEMG